ncbi:MAG: prepilin peptidase [Gammaproteobacteria bacterium]|nr:prepilin peptidase [Gammaproteobacteria bacterium]
MPVFGAIPLYSAAVLTAVALYTDARLREIPNWLIGGLALLWILAVSLRLDVSNASAWATLLCASGLLAVGYLFHRLRWLGGGDGKLMGVLALWIGPWELGWWLLGTAFLGLGMVLLAMARPNGDFRDRGLPFAWAIVPPAAVLLVARANSLIGV